MDADRFDAIARAVRSGSPRRTLLGLGLGGVLAALGPDAIVAKKKACPPCKKRKKGKCKANLPDGTACASGTCQGGSCVAASVPPSPPPSASGCSPCTISGQTCVAGQCTCPATLPDSCGGACLPSCGVGKARRPNCSCCIQHAFPDRGNYEDCCSRSSTNGLCAGSAPGNDCDSHLDCMSGHCADRHCSCLAGQDSCQNDTTTCLGGDGYCYQPVEGGPTRCGKSAASCGCTNDQQCAINFGAGSFCVQITGPDCTCGAGGPTTFCATPPPP
jgi:hypothetical protein